MLFEGKSIIVTGASSGLGAALAEAFAREGGRVTLVARRGDELEKVAQVCRDAGGDAAVVVGDVTQLEDCRRAVDEAVANHGGVDVLVANAGVSMWARFEDVADTDLFRQLIDVNYMGAVNCIHAALPHLKERRGAIAAVSSIQGKIPVPLHTGYVASKHALQGFLDTLRGELKQSGVDVITALPHWLRGTGLRQSAFSKDGDRVGEGRRGHSRESVSLEACSLAIVKAISRRDHEVVIPWKLKFLPWLRLLAPKTLDRIVRSEMDRQG
jgi:NAD(P)-dependent dehydrogenase (short-subunit alcohol dehydrogenase family)